MMNFKPRLLPVLRLAGGAIVGGLLLSGCGMFPAKEHKPEPVVARALPPPAPRTDGAIYQAGQQMELFADLKARRIGDILTIKLNESTAASKNAVKTKTVKRGAPKLAKRATKRATKKTAK